MSDIITDLRAPIKQPHVDTKPVLRDVEHRQSLNALLKVIWQTPMGREYKMILTMRVWGVNPRIFCPLTPKQIAQFCKKHRDHTVYDYDVTDLHTFKVDESDINRILAFEEQAKAKVQEFLKTATLQEMIDRFNTDNMKNEIFRNLGKPLK